MKTVKLSAEDFIRIMGYYTAQRDKGHFRYLFEAAVPNEFFNDFISWINLMELTKLDFSLWSIRRYDNYRLFYGFSDFNISDELNVKLFRFNFESTKELYNSFCEWSIESEACFISDKIAEYLNS